MAVNLPDSTHECDPLAPWNKADPWEGEECGMCKWLRTAKLPGLGACFVCVNPDLDDVEVREKEEDACDLWEGVF